MRGVIESVKKELKLKNTALNAAKQFMEQTSSEMPFGTLRPSVLPIAVIRLPA